MRRTRFLVPLVIAAISLPLLADPKAEKESEQLFRNTVAAILEANCLKCHNPKTRKGRLSLESASHAMKGGDSGEVIIPGKAVESLIVDMISGDEPQMPSKGDPLKPAEIKAIRDWIDKGAVWPDDVTLKEKVKKTSAWWSLQPIAKVQPPKLDEADAKLARNAIDAFWLTKLREQNLTPSAEADPRTLIRRLYFDLTGLPPTPQEVEAFVKECEAETKGQGPRAKGQGTEGPGDQGTKGLNPTPDTQHPTPDAYSRLVDRLLASPRYGERWARHWLDVVHYGDTHGYDKDKVRPNAWPYRDYVIRAFNDDKPFTRFIEEQIAGDVLHPGTRDGIIALGFIAAGPFDWVGQIEVGDGTLEKKRVRNIDRDDMVRTVMETFTSSTVGCARCHDHKFDPFSQEDYYSLQAVFAAVDRADRPYDLDPKLAEQRTRLQARRDEILAMRRHMDAVSAQKAPQETATIRQALDRLRQPADRPEFGYHSQIMPRADIEKWVQIDLGKSVTTKSISLHGAHDNFGNIGAGFGFPVRFRIEVSDDAAFKSNVATVADQAKADYANPGVKPQVFDSGGRAARYVRLTATRLAERTNDYILAMGEMQVIAADGSNAAAGATVTSLDSIEAPPRWRRSNLVDGYYYGIGQGNSLPDVAKLEAQRLALIAKLVDRPLYDRYIAGEEELPKIEAQLKALPSSSAMVYAAATSFAPAGSFQPTNGKPRPVHLLQRGNESAPLHEVKPAALACIEGLPASFDLSNTHQEGDRRAALARWIADPRNPLTWRSFVNRIWQYHFGRGLVDSPNDFGRMGGKPSHPQLLDWLAAGFRDGAPQLEAQSLKSLHRLIVTSAAYRRASSDISANAKIDAGNQYLWRMNRRRLEAEAVRDSVLVVAGKLDDTMYGPGFRDFGFKDDHSPHYLYSDYNPDEPTSHRRSIYRFIVRSVPNPFMETLDCADPSLIVEKRNETLTALQALSLLNNKFMVRMSEHFAARVAAEAGQGADANKQIDAAYRLAFGRLPAPSERQTLAAIAEKHGLANVCRLILNTNEFMFVD